MINPSVNALQPLRIFSNASKSVYMSSGGIAFLSIAMLMTQSFMWQRLLMTS